MTTFAAALDLEAARIDTHVHVVPPAYAAAINKAGGDPSGWPLPKWSKDAALQSADDIGVETSVLSVTSPGPAIAGKGVEGRELTRKVNEEVQAIVRGCPARFKFFASTPSWEDIEGTLEELDRIYKTSDALGVVVMTSYGSTLLGASEYKPIWKKLNEYKAVVFIHPTTVEVQPHNVAGSLPQPVVDYPLATTRCAVDLVYTKTMQENPDVKVILSHAGGALPFLAERAAGVAVMPAMTHFGLSPEDIIAGFKNFYLDLALSGSPAQTDTLLRFTTPDKILFGSDYPYAPQSFIVRNTGSIDAFLKEERGGQWSGLNRSNAIKLFGAEHFKSGT